MIIKRFDDCKEFVAGDDSVLREFFNPNKEDLKLNYSLAHAKVGMGKITKPHVLKTSEVYYIIEGKGLMYIDDESREVTSGDAVYIPPGSKQYIKNISDGDLLFLCIVDPAWKPEDEEVI